MARVSTYLNFPRETEQAFLFYRSVFGGDFVGGIRRFKDIPPSPEAPACAPEDAELVMHVELPILAGHSLMGTDAPESMGFQLQPGDNLHIALEPDSRAETQRLFAALSQGGKISMPLSEMFWGAYYGSCVDRFGTQWMFNCKESAA